VVLVNLVNIADLEMFEVPSRIVALMNLFNDADEPNAFSFKHAG
jgi:hypothetical protein